MSEKFRRVWFQRENWACCRRWGIGNTEQGHKTLWVQLTRNWMIVARGLRAGLVEWQES